MMCKRGLLGLLMTCLLLAAGPAAAARLLASGDEPVPVHEHSGALSLKAGGRTLTSQDNTVRLGPDKYQGSCSWQLVQDLRATNETYEREISLQYGYSIDYKTLTDTITNLKIAIAAGYKDSVSVEVGPAKVDQGFDFSTNFEVATQITRSVSEETNLNFSKADTLKVTVPPGATSFLYQLTYAAPGALFSSTAYKNVNASDSAPASELVTLPITTVVDIGKAATVIGVLGHTKPRDSNKQEWAKIRDTITNNIGQPMMAQIDALISLLQTINPAFSNKDEWANIRQKCAYIQSTYAQDPLGRIKAFFYVLNQSRPAYENTAEWAAIRKATYDWAQGSVYANQFTT